MGTLDRAKWPALCGLILGTILITNSVPTSFAFDKVVHTGIISLACTGGAVIALSRWIAVESETSQKGRRYAGVSLNAIGHPHPSREPSPCPSDDATVSNRLRKLQILFVVLVATLCLRVEVLRNVARNIQCSASFTLEPLIPVVLAAWDWWTVHRRRRHFLDDDVNHNTFEEIEGAILRSPYTYIAASALIAAGEMMALTSSRSPASTYICAVTLSHRWVVPLLQSLGSIMDFVVVFCVAQILNLSSIYSTASRFASLGKAILASSSILLGIGTIYFAAQKNDRRWILAISPNYLWDTMNLSIYAAITSICALILVMQVGVLAVSVLAIFTSVLTSTITSSWSNGHPFPPHSGGLFFLGVSLVIVGSTIFFHFQSLDRRLNTNAPYQALFQLLPSPFYLTMLGITITCAGIWASSNIEVNYHPIDLLVYEAHKHHETYLNHSSASTTLAQAVSSYRSRYNKLPPPHFDKWFEFAQDRRSTIIDSFDSIHRDLLPYYALSPADIRDRTWELIANPWNDAAGISIRDGKVFVIPNGPGTHRWMSDGLVEMIGKFAEWLPDMDLAFNSNDEARIAVPYEDIESMRTAGTKSTPPREPRSTFSSDRAAQWKAVPEEPPTSPLQEISWQQTFHRFGNVGCPPSSPARRLRLWDWSKLCTSCTYPQSLGAFLANWTTAANICHQPDLADLHGFYTSPAAFKGTHELYPIFSQSKPHGFNDILYPSAWNYLDKAKYEPTDDFPDKPFSEKEGTLFWRGATSEGVSNGRGQWQSMTRQRFVHLANNINDTAPPQAILLPSTAGKLQYHNIPVNELNTLLPTDVQIVDSIARCAAKDCPIQAIEFAPLATPTDFQHHWHYKYLLDLDGAGFSGRFLPFLQSRSLPFKAALVREWWDDRVTPWLHFVPLDLRGHGLFATLAYFHGVSGKVGGKDVRVDAHARSAARIAERGREWANEVLRKEDMEVYMFRLLLEWGRLTDDRREELGFRLVG